MKKIFLILAVIICVLPAFSSAAIIMPKPSNNLGLVGLWTFDGPDITTAILDRSGNGNVGYLDVTDATSSKKVQGKLGQGFLFDGNDSISITETSGVPVAGNSTYSYAFWVKGSPQTSGVIISEGGAADFTIQSDSGGSTGKLEIIVNNDGGSLPQDIHSNAKPLDGTWHHIVWSDNNGTVGLYIDGEADTCACSYDRGSAGSFTINTLVMGAHRTGGFQFTGQLDDVRAYTRALSAAEAKALYQSGAARTGASSATLQNGSTLNSGLVGLWTFDGADITTLIQDKSGNGNNARFKGGATSSAKVLGKRGQALTFDGTTYVNIASSTSLDISGAISISAWVKFPVISPTCDSGCEIIGNFNSGGATGQYELYMAGGEIGYSSGINNSHGGGTTNSTPIKQTNRWYHIVVTRNATADRTADTVRVYVDGVSQSLSGTFTTAAPPTSNFGLTTIGRYGDSSDSQYYMRGTIDDVRVYNRELTAAEAKQLYNLGAQTANASSQKLSSGTGLDSGLIGLWTFDGPDFTDKVYDRSGQGDNGYVNIVSTSSTKRAGKIGQAIQFDGTSYVVADTITPTYPADGVFTYAAWVKPSTSANPRTIFGGWNTNSFPQFRIETDNTLGLIKQNVSNLGFSSGTVPNDTWTHVAVTYDASGNYIFYINGVSSGSGTNLIAFTNGTISIGAKTSGVENFYGSIDDARIYSRVLSASEIKQLYLMGK